MLKEVRNVGKDKSESELADLRDAILHYLRNNPSAADSVEGVMNWWLPQEYGKVDIAKIEQVLEQLIAEGLVKEITLVDGTVLFKRKEPRD